MSFKKTIIASAVGVILATPVFAQDSGYTVSEMDNVAQKTINLQQVRELRQLQRDISNLEKPEVNEGESEIDDLKEALEISTLTADTLLTKNYGLQLTVDNLNSRIAKFEDPQNVESMHHHIFVTRTYSSKGNHKATIFYDNYFNDLASGDEIANGVFISNIDSSGIEIKKPNGETYRILKTTRKRAVIESTKSSSDDASAPSSPEMPGQSQIIPSF
jgi:hypothetical protein